MGAASSLVHAAVAEAPVAFVALVALPVTVVRWGLAAIAEEAGCKSLGWVVGGHNSSVSVGSVGYVWCPTVLARL